VRANQRLLQSKTQSWSHPAECRAIDWSLWDLWDFKHTLLQ